MSSSPENAHIEALVRWLSRAESYGSGTSSVTRIETHISWVFLTDQLAFKLKKPVRFPFLDFTSRETRQRACHDEVELNRRLAPDVYLGVAAVGRSAEGGFCWDPDQPLEWLVKMRRLDAELALDHCLASGAAGRAEIESVSRVLATFYARQVPVYLPLGAYARRLEGLVRENLEELLAPEHKLDSSQVQRVHGAQLRHLAVHADQFEQRVEQLRIVEGHGDLRPEHIYLTSPPVVIDCVEFRQDFRQLDALDELSFLAMECQQLDADWAGTMLIDAYRQATGDPAPEELIAFYSSYRGCVRAKVLALRAAQQTDTEARKLSVERARRYLELADRHARQLGGAWLVVVRGLTGTGKSTLARELADRWNAALLHTDELRRERFASSRDPVPYDQGAYQPQNRELVYQEMFRRAAGLLAEGRTVVLDGTFLTSRLRREAMELADQAGAACWFVQAVCPPEVARERIRQRGGEAYQSSTEVYDRQQQQEEPDPPGARSIRVDTTGSIEEVVREVSRQLA